MARNTLHRPEFHTRTPTKVYCRVATTANITIATALNAGDTLDGVTLAAGDRVLVKDQTAGAENGIYAVSASPARAYDMDTAAEVLGILVLVIAGTTNAGTLWQTTNTSAVTLGATAIVFAQAGGSSGNFVTKNEGGQETPNPRGTLGATETVDPTDGNIITGTLDQSCTITISAPSGSAGSSLEWWLTTSGAFTPTFTPTGGTFAWDGDTPAFPSAGTFRIITERIPGTTNDWIGNLVGSSGSGLGDVDVSGGAGLGEIIVATSATTAEWTASGRHVHIANEPFTGDGAQTLFYLAQEADDGGQSVAAYVNGVRTDVTMGGANDRITFAAAPASLAAIRVDYLALIP